MLQARFNKMHRGFQLEIIVVVDKKKDLTKLFGFTPYHISTWCSFMPVKDETLIKHNEYVSFSVVSGEMGYIMPKEWRRKTIDAEVVMNYIDEHRKRCRTYQETMDWVEKRKSTCTK